MMTPRLVPAFVAALLASTAINAQEAAPPTDSGWVAAQWEAEQSDIAVDPAYRFGVLDNGMRYILRQNATPEGTALVRLHIGSGSLDETETERGLAHFLEHMAFNGSKKVPEGEMVKLLEREGLAFGADTNATTNFENTVYKLNLPRNDAKLLDTALMLMRETASELTIAPDAVERERGVILAERRDRRNYALTETEDRFAFITPGARYTERLPIGTAEVLENATADDLRGFYERTYVPANTTLIVVGDFPLALMEAEVREKFADWRGNPDPVEPETGPVDLTRKGETDIYIDPALSERVTVMALGPWERRPDTAEIRRENLIREVGYGIINRRFEKLARLEDAPFRGAGFGVGDIFEDGRSTNLVVDTSEGQWQRGLDAAVDELRRALTYGFSQGEVAEQVARIRNAIDNAAKASGTRTNGALVDNAMRLIDEGTVPTTPESAVERFESYAETITPETALKAVLVDAQPFDNPLIRFQGRMAPQGGEATLRKAWNDAAARPVEAGDAAADMSFAYTDFGPAGQVVSDTVDERFGFRLVRFANGVMLNLKKTDIREDRISYRLTLDGGQLLETREEPLKTALVSSMAAGGLGKHSQDELETVLAGRNVNLSVSAMTDGFRMSGGTTPDDLLLQLQLLAAAITDPGYRAEAVARYRRNIAEFYAVRDSTPGSALGNAIGGILSDDDPRFTLQPQEAYEALTFEKLAADIGDRLARGALEIALVGDFDEDAAIAAVARTLGALPPRETAFLPRDEARTRSFTKNTALRTVYHRGEADQAIVRLSWPTTDDSDLAETLKLELLDRVLRLKMQEKLREELGKSYSPSTSSSPSRNYPGYGTFNLATSVDVAEVEATRAAIRELLTEIRTNAVTDDTLDRAREPLLEQYANMLKSLGGWLSLADRAQSESDRLSRFLDAPDALRAITPADVRAVAEKYLRDETGVEVLVLPETKTGPATEAADPE